MGIILVTGRSDRIDRIVGLEMGADDYVTKPLELRELVVRVKNLLWRIDLARQAQPHTQDNCYRFAGYCLNVSRHTLEQDGEPIKLTRAEYEMLVAVWFRIRAKFSAVNVCYVCFLRVGWKTLTCAPSMC